MTVDVLNGDALADRLMPLFRASQTRNTVFVMREALLEGPVTSWEDPPTFAQDRALHLGRYDQRLSADRYRRTVDPRGWLQEIDPETQIRLWFEYDVFCQVNLWFTCACIDVLAWKGPVSVVLPPENTPFAFAQVPTDALLGRGAYAVQLPAHPGRILWESYVHGGRISPVGNASPWHAIASRAVDAIDRWRLPRGQQRLDEPDAHPHDMLVGWYEASGRDFGSTFRRFCEQYPEYGFGDVQVRALLM